MRVSLTFKALVVFLGVSLVAFGQTSTGSISGLVQDQSGAAMPGAKVTITDVDTGIARSAVADAGGRYSVPNLIPDHYDIQAEMAGFSTEIRRGVQLTVGSELELNMALKVGQATEKVEVTTEAPLVETLTGTVSGLVNDQEIRDLPLNARSVDQFLSLESSTPTFRLGNHSSQSGVELTYIAHGGRDQMNQFLLDGMEMLGAYNFGTQPGGALGYNEGVDAVREFQVMTSNASAAYGKKAGAIVNMASKTGTNSFTGSAFEFLRNSDLDARNFFDHKIPAFRRNQFGGAIGGPIKKDRTFFFFSYEGLRQSLGLSIVETVPDSNARQGLLPCGTATAFTCNTSTGLANVGINPAVAPFFSLWPLANGAELGGGEGQAIFGPNQVSNQDFYLARVDHRISDKDSLFVRYTVSPANTYSVSPVIYQGNTEHTDLQMTTIQETRVISATTVNSIRAGVTRPSTYIDHPDVGPAPANLSGLNFIPGGNQGDITFATSATSVGAGNLTLGAIVSTPVGTNPSLTHITEWTFGDDVVMQKGPHSLHFGFEIQPNTQENQSNVQNRYGIMQFGSLLSFMQATPSSFAAPNPTETIDGSKSYRQTYTAAYIQDDYKVRRNLTLNLGLRWEYMTPPWEAHNRISNYGTQFINGRTTLNNLPTVGSPIYPGHYDNFAPRVGLAWDVFGDGKTAVRGAFGLFYDQIEDIYKGTLGANAPFDQVLQVANPPFPFGFSGNGAAAQPAVNSLSGTMKVPTRVQYNLSIEHQIGSTVFTIGYVGSEAYHLTDKYDLNEVVPQLTAGADPNAIASYFFPSTGLRANSTLASSGVIGTDATASYQGLDLSVAQRLGHGLRYKVNFTWSKSIDSASAIIQGLALGNTNFIMEAGQLGWDRSLSAFDEPRNLVGNLTYELPWHAKNGAAKWLGGWQIGTIITVQDGFPFTALTGFSRSGNKESVGSDRPNYASGINSVPILGSPTGYFSPSDFALPATGTYGDVGRNTLFSPGLANVDANIAKTFPITERVKLNFRAEFFNALNRSNFGLPGNLIFSSNGTFNPGAGVIQSTTTTSRQLQFGLKLLF